MATASIYPVRVDGELQDGLSRWLWLLLVYGASGWHRRDP